MSTTSAKTGYSADVQMELYINGRVFSIGQLGPDFLILRDTTEHAPTPAEISLAIDGREKRWAVHLPDGISPAIPRTRIASRKPNH